MFVLVNCEIITQLASVSTDKLAYCRYESATPLYIGPIAFQDRCDLGLRKQYAMHTRIRGY